MIEKGAPDEVFWRQSPGVVRGGKRVRISQGPFASFNGLIEEIDAARACTRTAISIFARQQSVEVESDTVEKL